MRHLVQHAKVPCQIPGFAIKHGDFHLRYLANVFAGVESKQVISRHFNLAFHNFSSTGRGHYGKLDADRMPAGPHAGQILKHADILPDTDFRVAVPEEMNLAPDPSLRNPNQGLEPVLGPARAESFAHSGGAILVSYRLFLSHSIWRRSHLQVQRLPLRIPS